jgi:hypothetical protein
MSNEENELVESVKAFLLQVKGVETVFALTDKEKEDVAALEKEAEGKVLMGMGEGDNQGVKEVFKREHIFCITTNKEYVWPEPPNVMMMQGGVMVGFDCSEADVAKYEKDPDYLVMGTFVISKKSNVPKTAGKPIVVLPPKPCDLGCVEQACDGVLGSPSTPSDEYIRKMHDFIVSPEKGTFFIGFNKKR